MSPAGYLLFMAKLTFCGENILWFLKKMEFCKILNHTIWHGILCMCKKFLGRHATNTNILWELRDTIDCRPVEVYFHT